MSSTNPLDSVIFISIPETFTPPENAFPIDTSIPLPVQLGEQGVSSFDITTLTWEMILAGILTILAYDTQDIHVNYYRNLLMTVRPSIRKELTETAILNARNEDYGIAEEIFAALRGLNPNDMLTVLNSALFFDQKADFFRKSGLIEDADACDNSADMYYKMVMSAEPAIPDSFFNAGYFYLKQRNFNRACECLKSYLQIVESDSDLTKYKREKAETIIADIEHRNLDDELFKSAYDCISSGDEEKGLEFIRKFLEKNPHVWNGWFLLGWALRKLQRWQDAKDAFLQVIEEGGENADTCNELSICYLEMDDYKESRKYLLKALSFEPENTKVISNLGFLALKTENIKEAEKYFRTVLEFDPKDLIAKKALEDMFK